MIISNRRERISDDTTKEFQFNEFLFLLCSLCVVVAYLHSIFHHDDNQVEILNGRKVNLFLHMICNLSSCIFSCHLNFTFDVWWRLFNYFLLLSQQLEILSIRKFIYTYIILCDRIYVVYAEWFASDLRPDEKILFSTSYCRVNESRRMFRHNLNNLNEFMLIVVDDNATKSSIYFNTFLSHDWSKNFFSIAYTRSSFKNS